MDAGHARPRRVLRTLGPAVLVVGVVFTAIGLISFFSAFGSFESPRYFWCAFIGLPLVGVGLMITKYAYLGAILRYGANEVAPVASDAINYMAGSSKGAIKEVATAVAEGVRDAGVTVGAGAASEVAEVVRCHKCNETNDVDANFCQGCGVALAKSKACEKCGELNDPDASFCDSCGTAIG